MPNILTVLCVFFCITEEDNDADMCSCVDCDSGGHRWKLLRTLILLLLLLLLHLRDIHFLISQSLGRTVYFTSFFYTCVSSDVGNLCHDPFNFLS